MHDWTTSNRLLPIYTSFTMSSTDWKNALSNLMPVDTTNAQQPEATNIAKKAVSGIQKNPLIIRFEKRNGKPTTIISRFEGDTNALQQLASELKNQCSAGGSAKDDEILIQGDVRVKLVAFLEKKGFTIKGDTKKITGKR